MILDVPAALKTTGKLRRLTLICHHNLLVFLAILLRVVQAGSSDSLNSTGVHGTQKKTRINFGTMGANISG